MSNACTEHEWRPLTDDEVATVRKNSRQTRPNMAWLESVDQCVTCGALEATVSWYGQVQRTTVDAAGPTVKWPTRAPAPGGGMSGG
jgi:hypothetical protein